MRRPENFARSGWLNTYDLQAHNRPMNCNWCKTMSPKARERKEVCRFPRLAERFSAERFVLKKICSYEIEFFKISKRFRYSKKFTI